MSVIIKCRLSVFRDLRRLFVEMYCWYVEFVVVRFIMFYIVVENMEEICGYSEVVLCILIVMVMLILLECGFDW